MAFAGLKKQINKANQVRNSFHIIDTVVCVLENRDRGVVPILLVCSVVSLFLPLVALGR